MHVVEAEAAEIVVHGKSRLGTDAERRTVLVGARTQVRDGAQKFIGMTFFLEREGRRIGQTEHLHGIGMHLPLLPLAGGFHKIAGNADGRARIHAFQTVPGLRAFVDDALKVLEAGAVVEFKKGEPLGIAAGSYPSAHSDAAARAGGGQSFADADTLHRKSLQKGMLKERVAAYAIAARSATGAFSLSPGRSMPEPTSAARRRPPFSSLRFLRDAHEKARRPVSSGRFSHPPSFASAKRTYRAGQADSFLFRLPSVRKRSLPHWLRTHAARKRSCQKFSRRLKYPFRTDAEHFREHP